MTPALVVLTLLASAVHSPAAHAEPPDDVEVFNAVRTIQLRYTELEVADFGAAKRQFRQISEEVLAPLPLEELTPYQASLVAPFFDALGQDVTRRYCVSLERAAGGEGEHAAIALEMLISLRFDPAGPEGLPRLLSHPGLEDAINGWFGAKIVNTFGSLDAAVVAEHLPAIERAILMIRENGSGRPLNRPSLMRLFEKLDDEAIADQAREARGRIHEHLLKVARSRLAKYAPAHASYGPERFWIDPAIDVVQYLEGPAAGGKIEGSMAAEIEFVWFQGPQAGVKRLSDLRGKVVVLDFWATWCGPCVASFPDVRELQAHYRGSDVVIIGVTSIQGYHVPRGAGAIELKDDPDRELALMGQYMRENDITWNIAFSSRSVIDPLYAVWGIPHMTIIDPEGRIRHNGLHPSGVPFEQKRTMIDLLLKEAGLALPR